MKVMISQPMNGLTDEEIKAVRKEVIKVINPEWEVLNTLFDIEFDNIEKITERFKDMEKKDVVNELTSMKESVKELNKQISDYVQENIKQKNKEQER